MSFGFQFICLEYDVWGHMHTVFEFPLRIMVGGVAIFLLGAHTEPADFIHRIT